MRMGASAARLTAAARRLVRDERGATAIEYSIVATGIAMAVASTVYAIGGQLNTSYFAKLLPAFQP